MCLLYECYVPGLLGLLLSQTTAFAVYLQFGSRLRLAALAAVQTSTAYFFFGGAGGLWMGSVGCFRALSGSTRWRRSSVPSSFLGFGPGLISSISVSLQPHRLPCNVTAGPHFRKCGGH